MYLAGTRLNHSAKATLVALIRLNFTNIIRNVTIVVVSQQTSDQKSPTTGGSHSFFSSSNPCFFFLNGAEQLYLLPKCVTIKRRSSTAMATTSAVATTTQQQQTHHLQTYWCHECDMSVFLLCPPTPSPARCPHCNSDFLEQMDSFAPPSLGSSPTLAPMFVDPTTTLVPSDENFLLDSPYLHRLIHHLTTTNDVLTASTLHHSPTSNSAIQSLQDLRIDASILEKDPIIPCPICKDLFVVNLEVKMLPCKHMYHSDCILPWLEMNNSCPVCRFRLPPREDEDCEVETLPRGDNFIGAMRLEEFMDDDDEELFGFQSTIRRIARNEVEALIHIGRRHQTVMESDGTSEAFLLSPTQIGEAGLGVGVARRATSVETVSSLPYCPGDSACEGEVGVSSSRLGERDAAVRS